MLIDVRAELIAKMQSLGIMMIYRFVTDVASLEGLRPYRFDTEPL